MRPTLTLVFYTSLPCKCRKRKTSYLLSTVPWPGTVFKTFHLKPFQPLPVYHSNCLHQIASRPLFPATHRFMSHDSEWVICSVTLCARAFASFFEKTTACRTSTNPIRPVRIGSTPVTGQNSILHRLVTRLLPSNLFVSRTLPASKQDQQPMSQGNRVPIAQETNRLHNNQVDLSRHRKRRLAGLSIYV